MFEIQWKLLEFLIPVLFVMFNSSIKLCSIDKLGQTGEFMLLALAIVNLAVYWTCMNDAGKKWSEWSACTHVIRYKLCLLRSSIARYFYLYKW